MAAPAIKMSNSATDRIFPDLPPAVSRALESAGSTKTYASGAVLFIEGECARGIFIVRRGRVKLLIGDCDGKVIVLRKAGPGEVLGISASVCASCYEVTAETQESCEVTFIRLSDFKRIAHVHSELPLWVAQQLSRDYDAACREIRHLVLPGSATRKLCQLLVDWVDRHGESKNARQMKFDLTHEEISEMIGTSRETVTRMFADLKKRGVVERDGPTLLIRDRAELDNLTFSYGGFRNRRTGL